MESILEFFSHLDSRLDFAAEHWGAWTYAVVFLIIFAETGLVIAPWLPGDSLLFALGAICARGILQLPKVIALLTVAAFLGNYTNFLIGRALAIRFGGQPGIEAAGASLAKLFGGRFARFVKPDHLRKAETFFRKYGLFAVLVCRFLPFLRTLVPFVAGMSEMRAGPFLICSAIGGHLWVVVCCTVGYYFFNIPWVRDNFAFVIFSLFAIGFVPIVIGYARKVLNGKSGGQPPPGPPVVEFKPASQPPGGEAEHKVN
ncbi:MAG: DedA family protein [Phycisphaerae bacterium]|nr:DedA family protein [Phycisphaerae bacterium]